MITGAVGERWPPRRAIGPDIRPAGESPPSAELETTLKAASGDEDEDEANEGAAELSDEDLTAIKKELSATRKRLKGLQKDLVTRLQKASVRVGRLVCSRAGIEPPKGRLALNRGPSCGRATRRARFCVRELVA